MIIHADTFQLLPALARKSVDLILTSPPYWGMQRDYGTALGQERALADYVERLTEFLRLCMPVLKPTGSLVLNLGDKYLGGSLQLVPYRVGLAALAMGYLLINQITWIKRNPTPHLPRKRLLNSTEPIFHFARTADYYHNPAFWGEKATALARKHSLRLGQQYVELINQATTLTDVEKQAALTALYEAIDKTRSGAIASFRMKIRGIHAGAYGGQPGGREIQIRKQGFTIIELHGEALKRDMIETPVASVRGASHPAMYPVELAADFIRLLTRRGDRVLDPFMGSGTTLVAAAQLGRQGVGIELNWDYCQYARQRLVTEASLPTLFD